MGHFTSLSSPFPPLLQVGSWEQPTVFLVMVRGLFLQFSLISAGVIQAAMQAEAAAWALSGTQKGPLVCGCSCPTKPKNGGIEKCPNMAVWICLDRETIGKR